MPDINVREHSFDDETHQLGVDFDGVIHKCSKGYYDGTVYDEPVEGVYEALEMLSNHFSLVCYTAKAKPDRPLVDGHTGKELVEEWLTKHNLRHHFVEVTAEKPRAVAYIDDKGIRFTSWSETLNVLIRLGLIPQE